MRRYLLPIGIVLGLHSVATLVSKAYAGFLVDVGGLFVRARQIEDIPDALFTGFSLVGAVLVLAAISVTYLRGAQAARPDGTGKHNGEGI